MFSKGFDHTIPPVLENIDFCWWKAKMESFIQSTSLKMWDIFENDFDFKPRGNWTEKEKNLFSLNIRAMQILYKGLTENDFQKINHCSSARDIWNTLDVIYASNPSLESTAVQSSTRALCGSSTDELLEADIEEADFSEESIHFCLEDSESEVSGSELELSELQDAYNELYTEYCKLAKELLGLKEKDRKLVKLISSSTSKVSKVSFKELVVPIASPLSVGKTSTCLEKCFDCKHVLKEKEKLLKETEISKEQKAFLKKTNHDNDRKSHFDYHSIICHYCGRLGHISHTCSLRRNTNVRNKFVWIPKGQVRSSANHVGPKYKWVPKHPSSVLLVQERSRVPLAPKKRTRGDVTAATTWSNHRKQCATTGNKGSVSRMSYHRVPLNYPEKNKRERIPRSTWRKPMNYVSHKEVLQPKDKYRRSPWVSKGSLRVEAYNSKISYANVGWNY